MSIQSLSIVVPGTKCINNCKFCVSRTHQDITYEDRISADIKICTPKHQDWTYNNYSLTNSLASYNRALHYARDLGCTTVMLTGECEPQQNRDFMDWILNSGRFDLTNLFYNIEIQTTGAGLDKDAIRNLIRKNINTFSFSLSSFENKENSLIINDGKKKINISNLCSSVKEFGGLVRLSLNLNKEFYKYSPDELFAKTKELGANQVTLRKLYKCSKDCPQNKWIEENCDPIKDEEYFNYIRICGTPLEVLPYGNIKYSVNGVGTVADSDCMAKHNLNDIRYLILRPDCHLYTRWDDPASIVY